ncbi:metallophosphoesterase [bacterium]|nr:metallophosphoesterase [bacterium]
MIILGLPDIHGSWKKLNKLTNQIAVADLVLLLGDITNFGHKPEMESIVSWVKEINAHCLAVPGNCDHAETEEVLDAMDVNLNGRHKIINNLAFLGLGASLATPFKGTPFEVSETYLEQKLENAINELDPAYPKILVSHQPPYNTTADAVNDDLHVGSHSVRSFIKTHQPMLCFTGHIHEGRGIDSIGKTRIINPSPVYQGYYAHAEIEDSAIKVLEIRSINE